LQGNAQVAQELEIAKQEIDDEGRIDLAHHGVLGVADEGLNLQILLDLAEEGLDLPALLVDVGDGLGRQLEMVGEKDLAPAGGGVPVDDTASAPRLIQHLGPGNRLLVPERTSSPLITEWRFFLERHHPSLWVALNLQQLRLKIGRCIENRLNLKPGTATA